MAVTVQRQFESAVTEIYQDAFVGSAIENGTTIIRFDLRKHDLPQELGTQAKLCWRKEAYHVNVHELSTFHNPIQYRFILAQGSSLDGQHQRVYFTPAIKGILPSQHMSHSVIRLACSLAVVCGVSLRHIALLFAALFLIPITKSSIKRVAYLLAADKYSRSLASRLIGVNQPVIRTRNRFSTLHPTQLVCI